MQLYSMFPYLFLSQADTSDTEGRDHNAASTNNYTIGSYNHHTVAIKLLQCETVTLSAQELLELKTVGYDTAQFTFEMLVW